MIDQEDGSCVFGIAGFSSSTSKTAVLGLPFIKNYDVVYSTELPPAVIIQRKNGLEDEDDSGEDYHNPVNPNKGKKRTEPLPVHYSMLDNVLQYFKLDHSFIWEWWRGIEADNKSYQVFIIAAIIGALVIAFDTFAAWITILFGIIWFYYSGGSMDDLKGLIM